MFGSKKDKPFSFLSLLSFIYFIFKDVDEDEVDEFIPGNCHLLTKVNLFVPIRIKKAENSIPQVTSVEVQNFHRNQFKYDATWFTKRFHNFRDLWVNQSIVVKDKIESIIKNAFTKEIADLDIDEWVLQKMSSFQERINLAKNNHSVMTSVNELTNSMSEENIDPGLFV